MIPGLEKARFLRYGQIHRNTYINAPTLLRETCSSRARSPAWKATWSRSPQVNSPG
jgi:folate-dependent tRNA-U54 methylase TrmFO/GidA